MIYRSWDEGWLAITQPAHAWLAGELAARWGNRDFSTPSPRQAVELATRLHDLGWAAWDRAPRLDESGHPVNFIGIPFEETVPIWRTAVAQILTLDPMAALLVSRHASTIYRLRLARGADPAGARPRVEGELARLRQEQEALRARLSTHPTYHLFTDPEAVERVYRWLRVCDLVSLVLCSDVLPAEGEIEDVPRAAGERPATLRYRLLEDFVLQLDPTPFGESSLELAIQARYLDRRTFPDQATFHTALAKAAWVDQKVIICSRARRGSMG